jgi:hypothetical protein
MWTSDLKKGRAPGLRVRPLFDDPHRQPPTPFRVSDLIRFIIEAMGRLDKPDTSMPYLRLKTRLESLRDDRRFSFMFSDWLAGQDALSQMIGLGGGCDNRARIIERHG